MNAPRFLVGALAALVLSSCSTLGSLGDLGSAEGLGKVLGVAARGASSLQKAKADLTPVQEYYLGRSFGATILSSRRPLDNPTLNRYVNQIGQALARFSEKPETYAGYRFLVLDSDEINAFAAPGGFILVTKGLVKLTRNEDELAAVLAHEISHVALNHGVKAIQKDRETGAWVGIGADAFKTLGDDSAQEMAQAFEGSVTNLVKDVVDKGYSRDTEFEADAAALVVLRRAGYPARALVSVVQQLKSVPQGSGPGFSKTHPAPDARLKALAPLVSRAAPAEVTPARAARYRLALGGL